LNALIEKIRTSNSILDADKTVLMKFQQNCYAEGLSEARILKYLQTLLLISRISKKSLDKATRDDILRTVESIERHREWSVWTKRDFKVTLKKFYKWLRGPARRGVYPEEVEWINTTVKHKNSKLPEDILTEDEIKRLAKIANNSRDKSLVLVSYESAARPSELLGMKVKNVAFDDLGAAIVVSGKTGDRRIRLVASAPVLADWINSHPDKDDPESYVWPISSRAVAKIFKSLATKARIKKRVTPYLFRHSRATHLATKLTEQQLKQLMGWTMGSTMAQVYVHLSGRDLDNALLELHGLKSPDSKEEKFRLKICPRCQERNSPDAAYCKRCAFALDIETLEWENQMMDQLIKEPRVNRYLTRMLRHVALKRK